MAQSVLETVRNAVSASQVFTEPVERDGATIIGVARVYGGGGGESAADGATAGGLGLLAGPVGAYVVSDGKVRFVPALDANRLVLVGGALLIFVLLMVARARRRRHRRAKAIRVQAQPQAD